MGSSPYWYIVAHEDIAEALKKLKTREFKAGRYNPVIRNLRFPITNKSPTPGPSHRTIREAIAASDAEGTRSILDIQGISSEPAFLRASPVPESFLQAHFGTTKPTREIFEANWDMRRRIEGKPDIRNDIERGHAVYFVLYAGKAPKKILFYGYSVD